MGLNLDTLLAGLRDGCKQKECYRRGHIYSVESDTYDPCPCWVKGHEFKQLAAGRLLVEPMHSTALENFRQKDCVIQHNGDLDFVRRHLARAVLTHQQAGYTWRTLTAQEIMDVWLDKLGGVRPTGLTGFAWQSLVIIFLGFGEMPNKEKGTGVISILDDRKLHSNPTWVVPRTNIEDLRAPYGEGLETRLRTEFQKVLLA